MEAPLDELSWGRERAHQMILKWNLLKHSSSPLSPPSPSSIYHLPYSFSLDNILLSKSHSLFAFITLLIIKNSFTHPSSLHNTHTIPVNPFSASLFENTIVQGEKLRLQYQPSTST